MKVESPLSHRLVEAVPVDFTMDAEPWSSITLADGSKLKYRPAPSAIIRLEGEYDPIGNPVYIVYSQNQMRVVSAGKGLRGEPTTSQPKQKGQPGDETGYR